MASMPSQSLGAPADGLTGPSLADQNVILDANTNIPPPGITGTVLGI